MSGRAAFAQLPFDEHDTSLVIEEDMGHDHPPQSAPLSDDEEDPIESPSQIMHQDNSRLGAYRRPPYVPLPANGEQPFIAGTISTQINQSASPVLPPAAMRKQKGRLGKTVGVTSISTATAAAISSPYGEGARPVKRGRGRPKKGEYEIMDAPLEDSDSQEEGVEDEDYARRGRVSIPNTTKTGKGPRKSIPGKSDPITEEEKQILREWVEMQAPETQRRQLYWEDFVKRVSIRI